MAKVNAASIDEAKEKAVESYENADFGEAADIDGEVIIVEDEDGEYVWEK